jgi:hypothetical protein
MEYDLKQSNLKEFNHNNINSNESINNDNICIRFIRKKFKCIIIFLLVIISISELMNNLLLRIDETTMKNFIQRFFNNTLNHENSTNPNIEE